MPCIKNKRWTMQVFTYCDLFSTCDTSCKKCVNATFRTIFEKTKKTKKVFFVFLLLTTDVWSCKPFFFLQGQCMTQFRLKFSFRHIKFRLVRWNLNALLMYTKYYHEYDQTRKKRYNLRANNTRQNFPNFVVILHFFVFSMFVYVCWGM